LQKNRLKMFNYKHILYVNKNVLGNTFATLIFCPLKITDVIVLWTRFRNHCDLWQIIEKGGLQKLTHPQITIGRKNRYTLMGWYVYMW